MATTIRAMPAPMSLLMCELEMELTHRNRALAMPLNLCMVLAILPVVS